MHNVLRVASASSLVSSHIVPIGGVVPVVRRSVGPTAAALPPRAPLPRQRSHPHSISLLLSSSGRAGAARDSVGRRARARARARRSLVMQPQPQPRGSTRWALRAPPTAAVAAATVPLDRCCMAEHSAADAGEGTSEAFAAHAHWEQRVALRQAPVLSSPPSVASP